MSLKYSAFLVIGLLAYSSVYPQDSITLMHYNLLYYGKNTAFCNASNNDVAEKQKHLKEILTYMNPDLFTVNELDGNGSVPFEYDATHLLDHTLNVNQVDHYRKAPFQPTYLANTLFYNANKLKMYSWQPIRFHLGDHEKIFNAYTFYYNARQLSESSDTTFLTCYVIHLKAGNSDSDALQRAHETEVLMGYIDNEMPDSGNYIICGDLNVYSSGEEAFQILTGSGTAKYVFYDPVDQSGNWHDREQSRLYHTQSTHIEGECFSGGGMDDRFDFILLSGSIMDNAKGISYIQDSYKTVGQDGKGFNSALRIKENESVPEEIARALYDFSDHLPVTIDLRIDEDPAVELSFDSMYHSPDDLLIGDSVRIYAQLTDTEDHVSSVKLVWGRESQHFTHQEKMNLSGNYYSSALKGPDEPSRIYYQVEACDSTDSVVHTSEEGEILFSADTTTWLTSSKHTDLKISNPVKDQIDLKFTTYPTEEFYIMIVDVTGKIKFRRLYSGFYAKRLSIPVSFLQPGIYWIKVQRRNSAQINMFIKQ